MKARKNNKKKSSSRFGPSLLETPSILSTTASSDGEMRLLVNSNNSMSMVSETSVNELPPIWQEKIEGVKESMKEIDRSMKALETKQNQFVMKVFSSSANDPFEIESMTADVQRRLRSLESDIKDLYNDYMNLSPGEAQLRCNAQKGLSSTLQGMMQTFKRQQGKYVQAYERKQKGEMILDDVTKDANFEKKQFFTHQQLMEFDMMEMEAVERNKEIAMVAKSMNDLNSMFRELSHMVIEQGTILDRIDYQIEDTLQQATMARQELVTAEKAQRNSRIDKCLTIMIIVIAFEIFFLMVKILF